MNQSIVTNIIYTTIFALIFVMPTRNALATEGEASKQEKSVCETLEGEGEGWLDMSHTYLSVQFCEPSVWFDSFFADERFDEEVRAGTRVRWRNDYVLTEGGIWEYTSNVHASFKLPKTKKSINIIFEGEEEDELQDVISGNEEEVKSELGLLAELKKSDRASFSIRVKLSPSITLRYRYKWPITDSFTTRFTQEWSRRDNADGTLSRIDFEKRLDENFFVRQSNTVEHSESYDGKEWSSSLVLFQHLTDKSALSYESSMKGVTEPKAYTVNRRLGVRYRKNFYRKWLFYEIAPAVNWSKPLFTDERTTNWELLFRLEVNFVNL